MALKDGGPAFPFEYHNQSEQHQISFFHVGQLIVPGGSEQHAGMTLRDYFAAAVLQGLVAHGGVAGMNHPTLADSDAIDAYAMADAMLKARGA